jgi:hypothetical protein
MTRPDQAQDDALWEEDDEYRQPCPNGCLGETGLGVNGNQVPKYCGVNGCDVESPGLAYRPLAFDHAATDSGEQGRGREG